MSKETLLFPARDHDHRRCVDDALARAERVCAERGVRLTSQRRRILELVAASHSAVGAYDIVDSLAKSGPRPAPITVYRALDFLIEQGLVHRLSSLNAYMACLHPGEHEGGQFLICKKCGAVAETSSDGVTSAILEAARASAFRVTTPMVEVTGLCRHCSGS